MKKDRDNTSLPSYSNHGLVLKRQQQRNGYFMTNLRRTIFTLRDKKRQERYVLAYDNFKVLLLFYASPGGGKFA